MRIQRLVMASFIAAGVPLALAACSRKSPPPTAEALAREQYADKMFHDIDAGRAWGVSSHSDVQFDEGFSAIMFDPPNQDRHASFYNHAFRWMGQHGHVRLKVHDNKRMRLVVGGWANEHVIRTHPTVEMYIDGYLFALSGVLDNNGHYFFDQEVPEWMLRREWVDLVIKTNAIGWHWADPPGLQTILMYRLDWTEVGDAKATP